MMANSDQSVYSGGAKIACAGIPRSGTTLMFRAMLGLPPSQFSPKGGEYDVVKTHNPDPTFFVPVIQSAIFIFGDPVLSVISTKKNRMGQQHFENCGAGHLDPEKVDIFATDCLNYEKMFDQWIRRQAFDMIVVRYETMYQNIGLISDFFGKPIELPPQKERTTTHAVSVSENEHAQIKETYSSLIRKIDQAPDIAVYRKTS